MFNYSTLRVGGSKRIRKRGSFTQRSQQDLVVVAAVVVAALRVAVLPVLPVVVIAATVADASVRAAALPRKRKAERPSAPSQRRRRQFPPLSPSVDGLSEWTPQSRGCAASGRVVRWRSPILFPPSCA